jgi:putative peptidoglycan lipid II flippase
MLFFMVPIAIGTFAFAEPLVHLLLERGSFTAGARHETALVVQALALGLPAVAIHYVALRAFWAASDMLTPFRIAVATGLLNIALDLLLMGSLGQVGIALSSSAVAWVNALIVLWLLARRTGISLLPLVRDGARHAAGCLPMLAIAAAAGCLSIWGQASVEPPTFVVSAASGACIYGFVAWICRWSEFGLLVQVGDALRARATPALRDAV